MAEKRVSVRIVGRGGDAVKRTFKEIGDSGQRGFAAVRSEMARAEKTVDRLAARMRRFAAVGAAAATAALGAMVRSSLDTIDQQAKLAQSLGTTTESVQVLSRAAELSGSSFETIASGASRLTKRLSLAEQGAGAGAKAFARLGLSAADFDGLTLVERIEKVQGAIERLIPPAERAGVITQVFGDDALRAFTRLDTTVLAQAREEIERFGVAISDIEADRVEAANDALSALPLALRGIANRITVGVAPALERMATSLAGAAAEGAPLRVAIDAIAGNLDRLLRAAGLVATFFAGRWVVATTRAAASARGLATALVLVRRGLNLIGIGLLITVLERVIEKFDEMNVTLSEDSRRAFDTLGKIIDFGISQLQRLVDAVAENIVRMLELLGILQRPVRLQLSDAISELRSVQDRLRGIAQGRAGPGDQMQRAELERREAELLQRVRTLEEQRQSLASAAAPPPPVTLAPVTVEPATIRAGGGGGAAPDAAPPSDPRARPSPSDAFFRAQAEGLAESRRAAEDLTRSLTGPFSEALRRGDLSVRGFANATVQALNGLSARIIESAFRPLEEFLAGFVQRILAGGAGGGGGGGLLGGIVQSVASAAFGAFGGGAANATTFASTSAALGTQGLFDASGSLILPFAKGGLVDRLTPLAAFARGGVIERPSLFGMQSGLGLAGEAGPEAIMPLRRGRGGRLGVEASAPAPELRQNVVIVDERDSIARFIGSPAGERALVVTLERAGFRRG